MAHEVVEESQHPHMGLPLPNGKLAVWLFLVIKGIEYKSKFDHGILPGRIFDRLDGTRGPQYMNVVQKELEEIVGDSEQKQIAVYVKDYKEKYDRYPTTEEVNEKFKGFS